MKTLEFYTDGTAFKSPRHTEAFKKCIGEVPSTTWEQIPNHEKSAVYAGVALAVETLVSAN